MRIDKKIIILLLAAMLTTGSAFAGQLSSADYQKLDPRLSMIIDHPEMKPIVLHRLREEGQLSDVDRINVLMKTTLSRKELNDLQVSVYSIIGDIVTCSIPIAEIPNLVKQPDISYIQYPRVVKIQNDVSVGEIGVPQVRNEYGLTGRNVIIGIVDTGIDWRHEDFRNADGTTRIKLLLDFSDPGDTNGDDILDGPDQYGGTLYTEQEINNALKGVGTVNENDVVGHGTHVAGSAAGNGLATGNSVPAETYVGVAPDADLIIVKATRVQGSKEFVQNDYINALAFIDSVANAWGQSYVVNLSLGGSNGPHDGKDLSEQAIDILVGSGKRGKAIVVSAGNDGGKAIHSSGTFSSTVTKYEISFKIDSYTPNGSNMDDYVIFEGWYSPSQNYRIKLYTPSNNVIGPVTSGNESGKDTDEGAIFISNAKGGPSELNGDKQIQIQIYDYTKEKTPKSGTWKIIIEGTGGRFDLWLAGATMNAYITSNIDHSMIVGTPGTAFNAITVGSYVTKKSWVDLDRNSLRIATLIVGDASTFSSPGPTRGGRIKPEICAPGEMITASYSADAAPGTPYSMFNSGNASYPNGFIARDNKHALSQGTSFAAPHVTGTIALMFQENSDIDAIQVRDAIIKTARTDGYTGSVPSNKWGYGKLDAYRAVQYIAGNSFEDKLSVSIFQNPALTQYIDFYLIAKSPLTGTPSASIKVGTEDAENITMTQLESLLYKGEYMFTRTGTVTLTVTATIQGETPSVITKYFYVSLLKANTGGHIAFGNADLLVPETAIHNDSYFTVFNEDGTSPPPSLTMIGKSYKFGPLDYSFDRPVQLSFSYEDHSLGDLEEGKLSVYTYQNSEWEKIESRVNKEKNIVTAAVSRLGIFAVLYDPNQKISSTIPESYRLYQNYPNPFNANTHIAYYLPEDTRISIKIYNVRGELITTLFDDIQQAGHYAVLWDGTDKNHRPVASGLYFYKLAADNFIATNKMILMR